MFFEENPPCLLPTSPYLPGNRSVFPCDSQHCCSARMQNAQKLFTFLALYTNQKNYVSNILTFCEQLKYNHYTIIKRISQYYDVNKQKIEEIFSSCMQSSRWSIETYAMATHWLAVCSDALPFLCSKY